MWDKISKICLAALIFFAVGSNVALAKNSEPEAKGIQAGNFVIHPGVDASVAYHMRDNEAHTEHNDGFVDIGAHLRTHLLEESANKWDNSLEFVWRQYWGLGDARTTGAPDVRVSTEADLFRQNTFRLAPSASYYYIGDPEDDNLRREATNHHVRGGLDFYIQPGAGAIFSQKLGYQVSGKIYTGGNDNDYFSHRISSLTRWNFMPNTSMALDIDFRINHFLHDTHEMSLPIRVKYDLTGLLLARLSYDLGLGYAYDGYSYDSSDKLIGSMFIVKARLRYDFTDDVGLFVEYKRDFDISVLQGVSYYKYNRVKLGFNALWFKHLQTDLSFGYGAFGFVADSEDGARKDFVGDYGRSDNLLSAEANIFYHFIPGFKLGLEYRLRYNLSNANNAEYNRNLFMLSLAYEY